MRIHAELTDIGVPLSLLRSAPHAERPHGTSSPLPSRSLGVVHLQDPPSGGGSGASQETPGGAAGDLHGKDAVRRMLQLLGPQQGSSAANAAAEPGNGGQGTSVEDFPPLLGESYLRASTHATAARMRSRLFQVCGQVGLPGATGAS